MHKSESYPQSWYYDDQLPPLTGHQAEQVLLAIIRQLSMCEHIEVADPTQAILRLASGRRIRVIPQVVIRDQELALILTVDDLHTDDMEEVERIRHLVMTAFPRVAWHHFEALQKGAA